MELSEFYRLIGMPPQAVQALETVRGETDLTSPQLDGLRDSRTAQETYQQLKEDDDRDHLKLLLRYLEAARRTLDTYRERHIPLEVYAATMSCFSRFLAEDQAAFGRLCFPRGWWTWRQTSMRLFRIGALEYELRTREERPVIDLHIPSDADLSPASVDRSLEQAEDFFRSYFPAYPLEQHTCCSWLLSPRLETLLPQNSNIRSFQRRFRILEEQPEDREYIQWLFQVPADTPYHRLPEGTSLQRRVKALLLEGGAIGCALGILKDSHHQNG